MKKIIIIGGGIGGLSAGIFAQRNGFQSVILEKNNYPGGECTGWDRNGYHIDGCIQWLVGTKEGSSFFKLWKTLGALEDVEIFHPDSFLTFEDNGEAIDFYRDLDKLKKSWLELSPKDEKIIAEFCDDVKKMHSDEADLEKPLDLMSIREKIVHFKSKREIGALFKKYGRTGLKEYAGRFQHPLLREAIGSLMPEGFSAVFLIFAIAAFTKGDASIPYGGSKAFAFRMAEKYKSLGGTIELKCEVEEIIPNTKKADACRCSKGIDHEADYFIAACDPKVLFDKLMKGACMEKAFQMRYENPKDYPLCSEILIALGYEGSAEGVSRTLSIPVDSLFVNEKQVKRIYVVNYSHDKHFAPTGQTLITSHINQFHDDYDSWARIYADQERYRKEKERIGKEVAGGIEKRFPEMKDKLKILDIATPMTFERYCNAHRGSFMAFSPTVKGKMMSHSGRIKGIDNVFLSGQWLQPPGGLPTAAVAGKDVIMRICKKEGLSFNGLDA